MPAVRFLLKRLFLILFLALLAGATGIYIDWHWKRPLSPRGGRYFFHRVELPVPSFRQGDERWRDDALGGVPERHPRRRRMRRRRGRDGLPVLRH